MRISQIAQGISESGTLKLNQTAASLRKQGEPIIHLGGGEPKSKAPSEAIQAASNLLATGEIRYTPASGTSDLKKAVIQYTDTYYRQEIGPKNVMVSAGAKQALMVCLQAIVDPSDEVIFPVPYWVSYPDMVKLCGGVPVPVLAKDGSFHPNVSEIEKKISSRTRAVIVNSPNNPTGASYSREFIAGMVELCEKRQLFLIMDDIYHRLTFDGKVPISAYEFAKDKGDDSQLVVINGVSKQYAMTGFRIGWAVASPKLIQVMSRIQGHQTSGPSALSQEAAIGAICGDQSSVEALRSNLESNRNLMLEKLSDCKGVKPFKPDATFYCFVDFNHYEKDSRKLAKFLLEKVKVVTVPGVEFGLDGWLRLSTCGSEQDIIEGVERIQWALDPESPKERMIGNQNVVRNW